MKTGKQILDEKMGMRDYFSMAQETKIVESMEQYANQKWNEAIELAAKEATIQHNGGGSWSVDREEILKLRK